MYILWISRRMCCFLLTHDRSTFFTPKLVFFFFFPQRGMWNGTQILSSLFTSYGYHLALWPLGISQFSDKGFLILKLSHLISSRERYWCGWLASVHYSSWPLIGSLLTLSHMFHLLNGFISPTHVFLHLIAFCHFGFSFFYLSTKLSITLVEWLLFLFLSENPPIVTKLMWNVFVNGINTDYLSVIFVLSWTEWNTQAPKMADNNQNSQRLGPVVSQLDNAIPMFVSHFLWNVPTLGCHKRNVSL